MGQAPKNENQGGVLFVGPGPESQGGIGAVIDTYELSAFWKSFRCRRFSSTTLSTNPLRKALHSLGRYLAFVGELRRHRPRAISLHTSRGNSFYRKLGYLWLARLFRVPVVFHIHPESFFMFYRDGGGMRKRLIEHAAHTSDQVVFLSENLRTNFSDVFRGLEMDVLANPVDIDRYDTWDPSWTKNPSQILYLGWIVPAKGAFDMVEVIPKILEKHPQARFILAGNKEVERLRATVAENNLDHCTSVPGWVEGEAKIELLKTSRALVLPSYSEGMPNVILEAMAARLPIVTTPVGGIPAVLEHERDCLFVEPGNAESIAEGLSRTLGDDALCQRLTDTAYQEVSEKYGTETIGERLRSIYQRYR